MEGHECLTIHRVNTAHGSPPSFSRSRLVVPSRLVLFQSRESLAIVYAAQPEPPSARARIPHLRPSLSFGITDPPLVSDHLTNSHKHGLAAYATLGIDGVKIKGTRPWAFGGKRHKFPHRNWNLYLRELYEY